MRLAYEVLDVFTDVAFTGNPLAVVYDGDGLTTPQCQALAREFNLSETAFPLRPQTPGADYRLRIFTPSVELPFAGHPTLGAAWAQVSRGRLVAGALVQECAAGTFGVEVSLEPAYAELTGGPPRVSGPLDPTSLLRAVGLGSEDLAGPPARRAGTGLEFSYLNVVPDAVARAVPDPPALAEITGGGLSVFAVAGPQIHARVFAGGVGVAEDPATGSAALGLGGWLVASGLGAPDGETAYVIAQGSELGRPSMLRCRVRSAGGVAVGTWVAGSIVPVARGEIHVPSERVVSRGGDEPANGAAVPA